MPDFSGYYALAQKSREGSVIGRQLNFYGGLRWRFEEHILNERGRIDRIALVRTEKDLTRRNDHAWSMEDRSTKACPWRHNLTAAVVAFRTAKALKSNPESRSKIDTFCWQNSTLFN